jgi:hypothetical protein
MMSPIKAGFDLAPSRREVNVCRNIKTLYNLDPMVTEDELRAAALQFVRKISGFTKPSAANEEAFNRAVDEIARASSVLLGSLVNSASPKDRGVESSKAHARALRSFGS